MSIQLDHTIVPSRDRKAAAELLAHLLGVPWAESGVGPFCPVYVSDSLTLDIDQSDEPFPVLHYCFRVSEAAFDGILARIKGAGGGRPTGAPRMGRWTARSTRTTAAASSTGTSPTATCGKR